MTQETEPPRALRRLSLGMTAALAASGQSQKDVAARCRISPAYLSKMLAGYKNPSQVVLERFAAEVGRRVGEIYDLGDEMLAREAEAARRAAVRRAVDERTVAALADAAAHLHRDELKWLVAELQGRLERDEITGGTRG
ncbi:MAG TPA: helix-turn-helix transcriptional regulator [Thermoanaerobaculia bacterium]|jgi:transcriptional regulator with XRE-family HTH domain